MCLICLSFASVLRLAAARSRCRPTTATAARKSRTFCAWTPCTSRTAAVPVTRERCDRPRLPVRPPSAASDSAVLRLRSRPRNDALSPCQRGPLLAADCSVAISAAPCSTLCALLLGLCALSAQMSCQARRACSAHPRWSTGTPCLPLSHRCPSLAPLLRFARFVRCSDSR